MLHLLILLSSLAAANSMASIPAKKVQSGTFYVCTTPDNNIGLTADLDDAKGDKQAVVKLEGISYPYFETQQKKVKNIFTVKPGSLEVKKPGFTNPTIKLVLDPESIKGSPAISQDDLTVKHSIAAHLTVSGQPINNVAVSCLESRWKY